MCINLTAKENKLITLCLELINMAGKSTETSGIRIRTKGKKANIRKKKTDTKWARKWLKIKMFNEEKIYE